MVSLLTLQVLGLWMIFSEVEKRALAMNIELMSNQVDTTGYVLEIALSELFEPTAHQTEGLNYETLLGRIENHNFPFFRYHSAIVARYVQSPEGRIETLSSPYNTLNPSDLRRYLTAPVPPDDLVWFPEITPDRQILGVRHEIPDGSEYGYMADFAAITYAHVAHIEVGETGSM